MEVGGPEASGYQEARRAAMIVIEKHWPTSYFFVFCAGLGTRNKHFILENQEFLLRAVMVAQLAERLLLKPEFCRSNPGIGKILDRSYVYC